MLTIALLGDVMLGREVGRAIEDNGPEYPWGDTLCELKKADLRIANLECLISDIGQPWPNKHYAFRAPTSAIESLETAGIDCVSLANNHAMDFGFDAMRDMMGRLGSAGIAYAGAGTSIGEAAMPALLEAGGLKVSMVSVTDNSPQWAAKAGKPGVFNIPLWSPHLLDKLAASTILWPKTLARVSSALSKAKESSDLAVLSAHTGPNNAERPSTILQHFAYEATKRADIFHGHSAHAFQGISMSGGKPVIFDSGDFVDDYPHNSRYHNEWGFIYFLDFDGAEMRAMRLLPIQISQCQANLARGRAARDIIGRMERLSKEMGTKTKISGERLLILP